MLRTASTPSSRSRRSAEAHILYAICRTEMSGRFFAVRVCAQAVHASAQSSIDNQLVKNLVEFRRRSGERKSDHFLRRHVRRRKYRSACKRARRPPKADGACAAVRPQILLSKKYYFFDSDNPAGDCLRGCLSMTPQTRRSIFLNRDAGELRLGQITPTALPSSRQTAS